MALAAHRMNIQLFVLDPNGKDSAAGQVAHGALKGDFRSEKDILKFVDHFKPDVLTTEIEHVDVRALEKCSDRVKVYPSPRSIEIIQDKLLQHMFFEANELPTVEFFSVEHPDELINKGKKFGWGFPVVLKARRQAYDGRGNVVIHHKEEVRKAWHELSASDSSGGLYVEKFIPYEKELATMVARTSSGKIALYPVVRTIQVQNICNTVIAPCPDLCYKLQGQAAALATKAVELLDTAGIFGVEMFLVDNRVFLNEIAPRPHNSGHYTIDACVTGQFEQHIRAILDMELGDPSMICREAIMENLIGPTSQDRLNGYLQNPMAKVHWYNKGQMREGRKMGHVTLLKSLMPPPIRTRGLN